MRWNFENANDWQILLHYESVAEWIKDSETAKSLSDAGVISSGKHLEMPNSWVEQFFLNNQGSEISLK